MTPLPRYLYRALKQTEIDAGHVLIPKARNQYQAMPILPLKLPFDLEESPKSARQRHQHDSHRYQTSYVSTTPRPERAEYYARYFDLDRGIVATKTIVIVDTTRFEALGINAHPVADDFELFQITKPEDEEIILEYRGGYEFPKEVIVNVRKL